MGVGENTTSLSDFRNMVTIGKADFVQPSLVKIGITAHGEGRRRGRAPGRRRACRTPSISGRLISRRCIASRRRTKTSPLERMFADFGFTPYAKTVPVIDGGIEVPRGPASAPIRRRS